MGRNVQLLAVQVYSQCGARGVRGARGAVFRDIVWRPNRIDTQFTLLFRHILTAKANYRTSEYDCSENVRSYFTSLNCWNY